MATYEDKASIVSDELKLDNEDTIQLLGMAYIADAINKGFKRLAKVVDNLSIEIQEEE